ncbi:MAG: 2OG-Fe dioxygenase family protein [Planctomycetes bacterium]|nr:2OG-Fe dioxygenase family protein [Planctomycetota bacterium]HPF13032.1 2OG-Fe dioxygenase family protein [Planctomycetota bacterium]HRV81463.1 2OG-Fe dioxygenase family protein [Planctomycetota bacterium]
MVPQTSKPFAELEQQLAQEHFAFLGAGRMRGLLEGEHGWSDGAAFAASWDDLPEDTYMADGGRYRQRRHAVFAVTGDGPVVRRPPRPHYQSRDRNPLNGGVERWFEPIEPAVAESEVLAAIFDFCRTVLRRTRPEVSAWHVEVHQFRILAAPDAAGQPTPEGMHRDGVDFVLALLIRRENVLSGTTSIADLERRVIGEFTLSQPFDAALVDDRFVYHGVTPITVECPGKPAYRDVCVVTYTASDSLPPTAGSWVPGS